MLHYLMFASQTTHSPFPSPCHPERSEGSAFLSPSKCSAAASAPHLFLLSPFSSNPFRIRTSAKRARNPFTMNTSKTKDLKPFRMNTYEKKGEGDPTLAFAT